MTSIHVRRLESRVARTAARFTDLAGRDDLEVADLLTAKLPWYEVRDQAQDGTGEAATVFIFDEIGGSFGVSAKQFAEDLEAITAPEIRVRINSPGGSVFDAIAIYNALRHHSSRIVVYVDSLAASAASVIAMGGDEIVMMPGSQMMIHDASMIEDGNAADMAKAATFLDRQSDNIADLYRLRAGGDPTEWRELMLAETWMFAREAVEFGLADRVHEDEPEPDPELGDRMTRSFDLSVFRYAGRAAAPEPSRRRSTAQRVAVAQRSERRGPVVTRSTAAAERRVAAERRADAAADFGYHTRQYRAAHNAKSNRWNMPAGVARSVDFPAQLRAKLETRNGQQLYHLFGQATVFDTSYEMWDEFGPYDEEFDPRALDESLAAKPDTAFLVNHRGVTMARTTNGTLEMAVSSGLDIDAWVNPKRQDVSDLVVAIEDRNVTEMSLAFLLEEGRWNADFTRFRIMRADINRGDVSAVNYGANPYTSIEARQRAVLADLEHMTPSLARAALDRLMRRSDLDLDEMFRRYDVVRDYDAAVTVIDAPAQPRGEDRSGRSIAHIEALLLDA